MLFHGQVIPLQTVHPRHCAVDRIIQIRESFPLHAWNPECLLSWHELAVCWRLYFAHCSPGSSMKGHTEVMYFYCGGSKKNTFAICLLNYISVLFNIMPVLLHSPNCKHSEN